MPQSPPLAGSMDIGVRSLQPVLPEFSSPSFSFGGSMELMAVPKKKVRYRNCFTVDLDFLLFAAHYRDIELYCSECQPIIECSAVMYCFEQN